MMMKRILTAFACAAMALTAAAGRTVVLGGSLEAVRTALRAKAAGKDVTVYAPRPYLGEDRAGTYDLRRHADDDPDDPLVREIFNPAYGAADAYSVRLGTKGWHACERIEPFANPTGAVAVSAAGLADVTTPFLVKRALDRALLKADIRFVTGAVVTEVRADSVRLATRTGTVTVPADEVIDCRIRRPSAPGDYVYAWNVVRDRAHPRIETVETKVRLDAITPRALAEAERQARDRLFAPDILDFAPFPMIRPAGTAVAAKPVADGPAELSADVVVVGGGTGGAPAAIAAARQGAKVAVVEFLNVLGGVTTEGRICGYYHGNVCGFTKEVDAGMAGLAEVPWVAKAEWYRRELGRLGADVFFGALGFGVVRDGNRVTGVRVAFPDGSTCLIACKVVIDATGNCDVAAAAGCETDYISADELSLQGAGVAPQPLGVSGLNSDIGFVDETSIEDISGFLLRTRLSLPDRVWNASQLADSRERRRLVGVIRLQPTDILAGRTYRDTIGETVSNFDTHGQTASDVFFVRSPGARGDVRRAQVPYRCLLPKEVDGLLVTGLGVSAHRDAMPVLRMQPDVQNIGYAAGVAAAMAVKKGVPPRQIDVRDLQRHLVAVGNVGQHVLTDGDSPRTDEPVFRTGDCAAFLARLKESPWDAGWDFKGMSQFGRSVSDVDMLLIALGKCRFGAAADEVVRKAASLTAADAYSHFRAIALAAEGCATTDEARHRLAEALHRLLSLPGIGGYARERPEPIPGFDDAAADRERTLVLRELVLARALLALGDRDSLGRRTLSAYVRDGRKAYAHHARLVLERFGGRATDTATLQAAIDAAAKAGGGVVRVPAGTYRCGSIFLRSNVTLDLAEGATIAASHDPADYNAWDVCPQNVKSAVENTSGGHLILCIGQTNVTLRGRGTIEGGGRFFLTDGFDRGRVGATGRNDHGGLNPQDAIRWRPSSMIYFVECADVRLEGLRFIDSPYWSVFLHGCERVAVNGITIRTSRKDPYIMNGDGLSLDCCRHVRVTGCDIETSDDALCLRANGKRLLRAPAETSDVRVGNCTLSSTQDAIRIGVGEGRIRDCVLTNLVIRDSRNGINFSSTWFKSHGVDFEDILISNVVSHTKFDFLRIHRLMSADSLVRGITIADVRGEQGSGSMIRARRAKPFRDILLKDIFLDKGIEVLGAENLRIEGGTLKVLPRTKAELDALDADIEAFRNLIH